jgi:hypothetical protein
MAVQSQDEGCCDDNKAGPRRAGYGAAERRHVARFADDVEGFKSTGPSSFVYISVTSPPMSLRRAYANDWSPVPAASMLDSDRIHRYPTTLFGFGLWAWQLRRYPAAPLAPYTLVVPVFGLAGTHMLVGEAVQPRKLLAAALVISGLVVNQFEQALMGRILRVGRQGG